MFAFCVFALFHHCYRPSFASGAKRAADTIASELSTNERFAHHCRVREQLQVCEGHPLASFLITPIQRVCRYPLLLKELARHATDAKVEIDSLNSVVVNANNLAANVNNNTN